MFKRIAAGSLCLFYLLSTACSVFGGRTQTVTISTEPAGARITINGMMVGVSPMQYAIPRKEPSAIMASKTGYTPSMRMTERHISPFGVVDGIAGFFTFGFTWFFVAFHPGAWKQEPSNIMLMLAPDETEKK